MYQADGCPSQEHVQMHFMVVVHDDAQITYRQIEWTAIYVCMYVCIYVYDIYVFACCVYIYIYIYIYMHVRIFLYI